MLALPRNGRVLPQSHEPVSSDSGSCSQSLCCQNSAPPGRNKQHFHCRLRLGKSRGAAQLSTGAHVTWMLRMPSPNHSLNLSLPQPFSTSLYISLIFHSIFSYFVLLSWSESHYLASFLVFQQTLQSVKDWSLLFLPPSQSLRLRRVTYFM